MKKVVLLSVMLCCLVFIGCDASNDTAINGELVETVNGGEVETVNGEEVKKEEAKGKVAAEIISQVYDVWQDSYSIHANFSIIIKNTGDKTIEIEWPVNVTFIGDNNSILKTDTPEVFPPILGPGETAILGCSTILDNISSPEDVKDFKVNNLSYSETNKKPIPLDLEDLNLFTDGDGRRITITGRVVNNLNKTAESIRVIIALFDKNNNLIGTIKGFPSGKIEPGQSIPFEAISYGLNVDDIKDEIDNIEGRAYDLFMNL